MISGKTNAGSICTLPRKVLLWCFTLDFLSEFHQVLLWMHQCTLHCKFCMSSEWGSGLKLFLKNQNKIAETPKLIPLHWCIWFWFNCPLVRLIVGWLNNLPARKDNLPGLEHSGNPFHKLTVSPPRKYVVKCDYCMQLRFTESWLWSTSFSKYSLSEWASWPFYKVLSRTREDGVT